MSDILFYLITSKRNLSFLAFLLIISCSPKKEIVVSETIEYDTLKTETEVLKDRIVASEIEENNSTYDTIIFNVSSENGDLESYDQTLKIVYISDSSIWFNVDYEYIIGGDEFEGTAINPYPNMDPEIDEDNDGLAYPATQYLVEIDSFNYQFLINLKDTSTARIRTTSNIHTDMIPLPFLMDRNQ